MISASFPDPTFPEISVRKNRLFQKYRLAHPIFKKIKTLKKSFPDQKCSEFFHSILQTEALAMMWCDRCKEGAKSKSHAWNSWPPPEAQSTWKFKTLHKQSRCGTHLRRRRLHQARQQLSFGTHYGSDDVLRQAESRTCRTMVDGENNIP